MRSGISKGILEKLRQGITQLREDARLDLCLLNAYITPETTEFRITVFRGTRVEVQLYYKM